MKFNLNEKYHGFSLKKIESLDSINSEGYLFKHEKSGARLVVIENDDDNKVFSVGFRTTPKDDTGVPHILEHSVLNGSKKYPIKDPFNELLKGSLNTFLNAMTFSDKTMYPLASCNDKDFANLCDVYMDSVFNPRIYDKPETFYQEGWRYEMFDKDDDLKINGIVYNEMKGAFSDPEQVLSRYCQNVLYPDNTYSQESGGDPKSIPDLSYEAFLGFHKKLYHPSNSYIFLYGNADIDKKLKFLDEEYLSKYDAMEIDSKIELQKPFDKQKFERIEISVSENESIEDKAMLAYNFVCGSALNAVENTAMGILEYVLLECKGAELKQALVEANIGKSVYGNFDSEILQPKLTIIAQGTEESKVDEFKSVIETTLKKIVDRGIDKDVIKAAINLQEFKFREADFGRFPKGLLYDILMMGTLLYDDDKAFENLNFNKIYSELKEKADTDYFEKLIEKYLLNNNHSAIVVAVPKVNLSKENDDKLAEKLAAYKATLSDKEIEDIVKLNVDLKKYQNEEDTPEAMACMPVLTTDDIKREAEEIINEEIDLDGVKALLHNLNTENITYLKLLFDIKKYSLKYAAYAKLLSGLLTAMNTEAHSYSELSTEINVNSGGINFDSAFIADSKDMDEFEARFTVSTKMFPENIEKVIELLDEILFTTELNDSKRLKELVSEQKSGLEGQFMRAGHMLATTRAVSNYSVCAKYQDATMGIYYYNFLCEVLDDLEKDSTKVVEELKFTLKKLLTKENLLVSITCADENNEVDKVRKGLKIITDKLLVNNYVICAKDFDNTEKTEGFTSSGKVQYVAMVGNIHKYGADYTGALKLITTILAKDYLYNNIRVQGGAYGAMSFVRNSSDICFVSYRDPNLVKTIDTYKGMYEYIRELNLSKEDLTKYVIGTFADMDIPKTPREKGEYGTACYLTNRSYEDIQKIRDEIIDINIDDLRSTAEVIKKIIDDNYLCVVGGEESIKECKEIFDEINPLLK